LRHNVAATASDLFGNSGREERDGLRMELPGWTRQ
jgi:hypothetical protein